MSDVWELFQISAKVNQLLPDHYETIGVETVTGYQMFCSSDIGLVESKIEESYKGMKLVPYANDEAYTKFYQNLKAVFRDKFTGVKFDNPNFYKAFIVHVSK